MQRVESVFEALVSVSQVVTALTTKGLMVILNNHISKSGWCCTGTGGLTLFISSANLLPCLFSCNLADGEGLWYTTLYPDALFFSTWYSMATLFKDNLMVIGADLRNELRNSSLPGGRNPRWTLDPAEMAMRRQQATRSPQLQNYTSYTDWSVAATVCGNMVSPPPPCCFLARWATAEVKLLLLSQVLQVRPDWLIFVEGLDYANTLQ